MNRPAKPLAVVLAVAVLAAGAAIGQPKNNIGEPLAQVMLAHGCAMTVPAAMAALERNGLDAGDFQAQEKSLYKGGYLVQHGERLRLTNWGACK